MPSPATIDEDEESPVALSAPMAAIPPFPVASSSSSSSSSPVDVAAREMRAYIDTLGWPKTLIYRGDASGDLTQVVTALSINEALTVAVVPVNTSGKHLFLYNALVHQYGFGPERIFCFPLKPDGPDPMAVFKRLAALTQGTRFISLSDCTKIIAGYYKDPEHVGSLKKRDLMQRRPGVPGIDGDEVDLFNALWSRFLGDFWKVCDRDVAVLWGRRSGMAPGGAHPEYDHSDKAMGALARMLSACGFFVVFAGDFPEGPPAGLRDPRNFALIGAFWKLGDGRPDLTYPQQARFFHMLKWKLLLRRHFMIHVGMRSGTMERMAMSNFATLYIVNGLHGPLTGDPDNRLAPLVSSMHDRYLFRRVQLDALPRQSRNTNWTRSSDVTPDLLKRKMMLSEAEIGNVQEIMAARSRDYSGDLLFLLSMIENVRRELLRKLESKAGRPDFFDKHPAYREVPGFLMAASSSSSMRSAVAVAPPDAPEGKEEMVASSSSSSIGSRVLPLPAPDPLPRSMALPSGAVMNTPSSSSSSSPSSAPKRGGHRHGHGKGAPPRS